MAANNSGFVGRIPEFYDEGLGPLIFVDAAAETARRVAAGNPKRVLETAAGTGIVTKALRAALPAGTSLTATDLNPPMLDVARKKFAAGENVVFQPADAMALPFPDGSFDAVVCQFGSMFYPDKDRSYREVFRVLVPGGRYVFSVWDAQHYNSYARIASDVIGSFFSSDPPPFYRIPFSMHELDPVRNGLDAAGFSDVVISIRRWEKAIPEARVFARALIYGNPAGDQVRERGGDPEVVMEAVLAALHREFGPDPGKMPLQAIVYEACKPE